MRRVSWASSIQQGNRRRTIANRRPISFASTKCRKCKGTGVVVAPDVICRRCGGAGQDPYYTRRVKEEIVRRIESIPSIRCSEFYPASADLFEAELAWDITSKIALQPWRAIPAGASLEHWNEWVAEWTASAGLVAECAVNFRSDIGWLQILVSEWAASVRALISRFGSFLLLELESGVVYQVSEEEDVDAVYRGHHGCTGAVL